MNYHQVLRLHKWTRLDHFTSYIPIYKDAS